LKLRAGQNKILSAILNNCEEAWMSKLDCKCSRGADQGRQATSKDKGVIESAFCFII